MKINDNQTFFGPIIISWMCSFRKCLTFLRYLEIWLKYGVWKKMVKIENKYHKIMWVFFIFFSVKHSNIPTFFDPIIIYSSWQKKKKLIMKLVKWESHSNDDSEDSWKIQKSVTCKLVEGGGLGFMKFKIFLWSLQDIAETNSLNPFEKLSLPQPLGEGSYSGTGKERNR